MKNTSIIRRTPIKRGPKKVRGFMAAHIFDVRLHAESCMTPKVAKDFCRTNPYARDIQGVSHVATTVSKWASSGSLCEAGIFKKRVKWVHGAFVQRIKSRSPKKAADDRKYAIAKMEHFAEFPGCQHPDGCTRSLLKGDQMDLHHASGRNGPLLYCKKYMRTACRPHHNLAKDKPKQSRSNGWVIDVSSEEVRALRNAELMAK